MSDAMSELSESNERISYQCNICGGINEFVEIATLDRETGPCRHCGAQVRLRAITHLISQTMFGQSMPVCYWPQNSGIVGIGISDWVGCQPFFDRKIQYINGQYHAEPLLDIRSPPTHLIGTADFVSCSDVFEHVDPPIERAFAGLHALLKPNGWLIFSVPYSLDDTIEHFPRLNDWKLIENEGQFVLKNITKEGRQEEFRNLCFHGGPGQVLEMRIFGLTALTENLRASGFSKIQIMDYDVLDFGIKFKHPWSLPLIAQRSK